MLWHSGIGLKVSDGRKEGCDLVVWSTCDYFRVAIDITGVWVSLLISQWHKLNSPKSLKQRIIVLKLLDRKFCLRSLMSIKRGLYRNASARSVLLSFSQETDLDALFQWIRKYPYSVATDGTALAQCAFMPFQTQWTRLFCSLIM